MSTGVPEYHCPGYGWRDHVLRLPLDYDDPGGERIDVFAREVVRPDRCHDDLPWLLYLQGGPGHKADRPEPGLRWLERALQEHRVLLLDQRGTGLSTPVSRLTLPRRGTPDEQARYLTHFRADSIVKDAEEFRRHLAGPDVAWSVLGQSFGGFCAITYLSFAPDHLREVLIAGGLPSLTATADEIYRAAYPRVREKNVAFFDRYPGDRTVLRRLVDVLSKEQVALPGGDRLSPRRLQTIGIELGMAGRFDGLHFLLEEAFVTGDELSDTFLRGVDGLVSYARHPLFATLHEPIYAQGSASAWAAHRVREEFPEFDPAARSDPVLLTGEMIYPWLFDEDPALSPVREAAALLASRTDWPPLYDPAQLARNTVPTAAAVYHDDMYVDREMSLDTARSVGSMRVWVTNELEHDGLRQADVLDHLMRLSRGLS